MTKENIEKFKNDPVFLDKLKEVKTKSELFAILKEAGYEFNQEELKEFTPSDQKVTELYDEELDKVAGGSWLDDLVHQIDRNLYIALRCRKSYVYDVCEECKEFVCTSSIDGLYRKCNKGYFSSEGSVHNSVYLI
ncbi:Nif11-like leader peptide family natural product precursor [Petroclostridium sp. X23]|uniref:Nif11-like leader peptide family natural product precursor n=1 Tax=Petroclostridium sp. X23 TaxID=3045146 RepID=UPI0024AE6A91|nr:Nif11-like leader peptide family natural product precursor [Petroclostridium sp. X23]WHH61031.1 Nif11-like leader peptide family natural product precursor [Petroclostridium sp. X23]